MTEPGAPAGVGANIAALLATAAEAEPDRPAVILAEGATAWTAGGLTAFASRGAEGLARAGVGAGDGVVTLVPGRLAAGVAAAVLWAGAVLVVPPTGDDRASALRAALAMPHRGVVADPLVWLALVSISRAWRTKRFVPGWAPPGFIPLARHARQERDTGLAAPAARSRGDPAVVSFTTGTTGDPRPVLRSHGVLLAQHAALDALRPAGPDALDLAGLPMLILHDIARGVPAVLPRVRGDVVDRSVARRLTSAAGTPALIDRLVRCAPRAGLPLLESVDVGGGPVPPELVRRIRVVAPKARVTIVYGATEAEPIAAIDGDGYVAANRAAVPGDGVCVGRPVPGLAARVVAFAEAPDAAWGRLEVRGPQVVPGATGATGWRDLGDAARVDEAGRIWLLGRARHALDGVPPLVIEQVAEAIPGVRAAALVAGVAEGVGGPAGVLAIEAAGPVARGLPARVEASLRDRGWSVDVRVVPRLPRDARSGTKVDYRRLMGILSAADASSGALKAVVSRDILQVGGQRRP